MEEPENTESSTEPALKPVQDDIEANPTEVIDTISEMLDDNSNNWLNIIARLREMGYSLSPQVLDTFHTVFMKGLEEEEVEEKEPVQVQLARVHWENISEHTIEILLIIFAICVTTVLVAYKS